MATLIRVKGPVGVRIFSGEHFTEEQAKEAYLDEYGEEPEVQSHTTSFDVMTQDEMSRFVRAGCE